MVQGGSILLHRLLLVVKAIISGGDRKEDFVKISMGGEDGVDGVTGNTLTTATILSITTMEEEDNSNTINEEDTFVVGGGAAVDGAPTIATVAVVPMEIGAS